MLSLTHPEHDTQIRLIPQMHFGATGSLRSISYTQIPDITVEVRRPGSPPRLYFFDPRYKLLGEVVEGEDNEGRPTKVDIDKMHTYRDAVRDNAGRRIVEMAVILYPGLSVQYAAGIEAIQAYPGGSGILQERLQELIEAALSLQMSKRSLVCSSATE